MLFPSILYSTVGDNLYGLGAITTPLMTQYIERLGVALIPKSINTMKLHNNVTINSFCFM